MRWTSALVVVMLAAGCRERPPPPPSFADLDASPPESGPRGAVVGGGGGGGGAGMDAGGPDAAGPSTCRGTLLVVFDRSGSMAGDWEPELPKWRAATDALEAGLGPLVGQLNVGAILFPSGVAPTEGVCAPVDPIEAQVPIGPGETFLSRFATALPPIGGRTPLDVAFTRADEALDVVDVDGVVVLTDGQPTCVGDVDAVTYAGRWRASGIRTWVIGLPGIDDPGVLDRVAAAGGTIGHIPVDDPSALTVALEDVARESFSQACL